MIYGSGMEIIDPSTVNFAPARERSKYPWSAWLDGNTRKASNPADFTIAADSFRTAIVQAAQTRNLKVYTKVDGQDVYFQSYVPAPVDGTVPESATVAGTDGTGDVLQEGQQGVVLA